MCTFITLSIVFFLYSPHNLKVVWRIVVSSLDIYYNVKRRLPPPPPMPLTEGCMTSLCVTVCLSPQSTVNPPPLHTPRFRRRHRLAVFLLPVSHFKTHLWPWGYNGCQMSLWLANLSFELGGVCAHMNFCYCTFWYRWQENTKPVLLIPIPSFFIVHAWHIFFNFPKIKKKLHSTIQWAIYRT